MTQRGLRIGQLAKLLGTTTKTLRFYESVGLLSPPRRSAAGYRVYDDAAAVQARRLLGLRRLDLNVRQLQDLLASGAESTLRRRLLALMDEKLRDRYLDLGILQGRCDDLAARHQALLMTPRDRPQHCVCDALFTPCSCNAENAPPKRNAARRPAAAGGRRAGVRR
ncbi:MAG: MerR family transcriptional regulator [Betaproteobacteria bacterium]|nr:MerR family transcriptional regulator [Betaproteobacteria bacterium]